MGTAVGLDFGTTNTVVTYLDTKGKFRAFKQNGSPLFPSVIFFKSKDDYVIGETAKQLGEGKNSEAKISSFKTALNNDNKPYILKLDDDTNLKIMPKAAVRFFLNKLMREVQEYLIKKFGAENGIIDRAVITVPTKFKDSACNAIKTAAASAMNLNPGKIKLVYEPTAAAVAAQRDEDTDATKFLIYDFGGGTFDVSLMQKENNVFKQIVTDGDPKCGGDLLTNILAKQLLEWANEEYGTNFPFDADDFDEELHGISEEKYKRNLVEILNSANKTKINLSEEKECSATFQFWISDEKNENYIVDVSRVDFENLIRKVINHTAEITQKIVDGADAKSVGGIDKIVLAGGSSQIPMIREILRDKLGKFDINYSDNVSTLISRGAAILAQNIESLENVTSQKTTMQLGISTTEGMQRGIFKTIIDKDLSLPCENESDFRLLKDNQSQLKISYYERDIKNFPDAKKIGDDGINQVDILNIDLPQGLKKDSTIVRIKFKVNKDSSLEFSAKVLSNDGKIIGEDKIKVSKDSDLF